jgi:hypothetical protein
VKLPDESRQAETKQTQSDALLVCTEKKKTPTGPVSDMHVSGKNLIFLA